MFVCIAAMHLGESCHVVRAPYRHRHDHYVPVYKRHSVRQSTRITRAAPIVHGAQLCCNVLVIDVRLSNPMVRDAIGARRPIDCLRII